MEEPLKDLDVRTTSSAAATTVVAVNDPGIKSILSSLSDKKIKELASVAMSTFGGGGNKDIKTEISVPAESTSLMKGNLPKYSISTAELVAEDARSGISRDSHGHVLSLDERLQATFGNAMGRPKPDGSDYHSNYPHSHSQPPPTDYYSHSNPSSHDQNYNSAHPSVYQQRQTHPSHPPPLTGPGHMREPHPQSEYSPGNYQTYQSSPHGNERGYDSQPYRQPHPPHYGPPSRPPPPDRYSADHSRFGPPPPPPPPHSGRYDYSYRGGSREDDHYRNTRGGDGRGI